jgi:hypothetical protein
MNGYGIFFWKDGRIYKGYYKDDKKHSFGMYYKSEGKKYEGNWENGSQKNLGKYTKVEGNFKLGIWNENNLVDYYREDHEKFKAKFKEIEDCIEETNQQVDIVVENLRECFSIFLPDSKIEDFLE